MPLGGAPTGVVITFSDITTSRHTQDIVRASEERYRGLIESLPLMVTQCDRSFNVVYANPALRFVTGYDAEEVAAPEFWKSLVVPEDLSDLLAMFQGSLEGQSGRVEARFRAKDDSEKVAFFLSQPRRLGDAVVGITTLMVDMTRERRLEGDLQRAQRLELVGRLSSGIAHDFNNLLSVVLGLTDLARASLPMDHPTQSDLLRISEAGEQAADLARQLLTFSNNQRRSPSRRVEVTRVIRRTLDLVRATLPASIEVKLNLSSKELFVQGDETQLHQVVMNLCLNAREAMLAGGRLTVTANSVLLPASKTAPGKPQCWVELTVRDEGPGITRQLQEKIFDPFFSTKERGTGLGLAVVQQIVQGCGGHIELTSQPGHGACFEVWLPQVGPEAPGLGLTPEHAPVSQPV
jgi:PAS domain S-box-containing protein